ncbi:sugar porter family MFS transporter [Petrimonas sp.]|uniref:sugar porter family MFS transporter n=1 Tax=Petrimonas sp. TaxID=2023866 RepID=UPI003F516430
MNDKDMIGKQLEINNRYLILIALVASLGGFLFGYDWVVIGGAKPFYEIFFSIDNIPWLQGWAMSSAILGCLIGVAVSGSLTDKYGRRTMFFIAALIFTISAIGTGAVNNLNWFIFYRIFGGIGIGLASNISPMYISEISPPSIRGRFITFYQLAIVLGILFAQIANWLIAHPVVPGESILSSWNGQTGWRWMFWAETIPAMLFFVLVFFIPESPRWLVSKQRFDKALNIFTRMRDSDLAHNQLNEIKTTLSLTTDKISFRDLFKGKLAKLVIIGIVIAVLQQWSGINVIFNYAQEIFSGAGYSVSDMLFNIVITGIVNVVFTFIGMYTVDKLGRRSLMLFGTIGLTFIYLLLGAGYFFQLKGIVMLLLVVLAIATYAMTLAPVTWVVIAEIFPTKIRGLAMAVSTFALWAACFVLTYTFPLLNNSLGSYGTFWVYGVICLAGFIFIKKTLPETKGKTLEEIEKEIVE